MCCAAEAPCANSHPSPNVVALEHVVPPLQWPCQPSAGGARHRGTHEMSAFQKGQQKLFQDSVAFHQITLNISINFNCKITNMILTHIFYMNIYILTKFAWHIAHCIAWAVSSLYKNSDHFSPADQNWMTSSLSWERVSRPAGDPSWRVAVIFDGLKNPDSLIMCSFMVEKLAGGHCFAGKGRTTPKSYNLNLDTPLKGKTLLKCQHLPAKTYHFMVSKLDPWNPHDLKVSICNSTVNGVSSHHLGCI